MNSQPELRQPWLDLGRFDRHPHDRSVLRRDPGHIRGYGVAGQRPLCDRARRTHHPDGRHPGPRLARDVLQLAVGRHRNGRIRRQPLDVERKQPLCLDGPARLVGDGIRRPAGSPVG